MVPHVRLTPKQSTAFQLLWDSITGEVAFGGGAGGGKSWLGCIWLVASCYEFPETKWFIGRNELKRLMQSTRVTFSKVLRHYGFPEEDFVYHGDYNYTEHVNGSRIDWLDLKQQPRDPLYERFGSLEFTGGWLEEASEVEFDAYDILKSRIGRHLNDKYGILGKLFVTCNPSQNWLYQTFYKPWKENKMPDDRAFIQSLVGDNEFRESGTEAKLESIESEAQKQRLLFGNWDYEVDPDQLITYQMVDQAINRHTRPIGQRKLGVDVARYGDDKSVIAERVGPALIAVEAKHGLDTIEVGEWVIRKMVGNVINSDNVNVDTDGLGAGTSDHLVHKGYHINQLHSGHGAIHDLDSDYRFKNFRSQMWWSFREGLKSGEYSINCEHSQLIEDLTAPRYEISNDKVIKVESKDDIKKRIGRSPDVGDAVVYAFAPTRGKPKYHTKRSLGVF